MPILVGPDPEPLPPALLAGLARISFPTLGHYLESGFADPSVQRLTGAGRVIGHAWTVRITATDSTVLHHAAGLAPAGSVVVVDTGGDRRHACLGEVVATQLLVRGVAGAVVDGAVTDAKEINAGGLAVFARGRSQLTTKLHGLDQGGLNIAVTCGGVTVHAGDVVLGDDNGVCFLDRSLVADLLPTVLADDAEEPELIAQLRSGARLGALTGASEQVRKLAARLTGTPGTGRA